MLPSGRKALAIAGVVDLPLGCAADLFRPSQMKVKSEIEYADQIRQSYNFHFGTDKPFLPGNPSVEGNDFLQPGAFPNATYCAHCHQEAYSQWRQALHSNSFRTPFYRTSVNILLRTKGIEFTRHCDSCHNPDRRYSRERSPRIPRWIGASMRMASPAPPATPFKNCNPPTAMAAL